jgi:hypothetical protein
VADGRARDRVAAARWDRRPRRDDAARVPASFAVYRWSTEPAGSSARTTGFADPAVDFPRYARWHLDGRLPVERLIDRRRSGSTGIEAAFRSTPGGRRPSAGAGP